MNANDDEGKLISGKEALIARDNRPMSRLEILKKSLKKKEEAFNSKLNSHFEDVKSANGQPLNDKKNGQATLDRWNKQSDSLRNLDNGIKKTKDAIEREELKIANVEHISQNIPKEILDLVANGTLIQWRKHPSFFFVSGVDKARIIWDAKRKVVAHRYLKEIKNQEQWSKFRDVYNSLNKALNEES
ncbi:hypothetical protein 2F2_4 [uncultured Caudovirales phage]|uniref:Uncharacterized protein n=1 Tax=uncultured Caudovirales phage TaxID=2100421 RepID=A0A2H4J4Q4_9CAUD|nr:hypothetical protein 2F2_4 [uncultured Caudovirales phage]